MITLIINPQKGLSCFGGAASFFKVLTFADFLIRMEYTECMIRQTENTMKFLLAAIHAKYIHTGLALYSLRGYAGRELREYIEVAEYTINQQMEEVLADLYDRKPDAIGFSCYIWNFSVVKRLVREFSKLRPDVPVWLGGPEVSYEYKKIFEELPEVTGIMSGEGEETFRELLELYVGAEGRGGDLRELPVRIAGTVTKEGDFGVRRPLDLDKIPFYYEDLEEEEKAQGENKILYYESGRGCPFRCSYCLSSIEKQVRLRSLGLVKRELRCFLERKVKQVKFIDRTFNCNRDHAEKIWRFLLENDNGVTNFHFEISAELLTEEQLELLSGMRPGLIQLEIGVQTTNRKALQTIHRHADPEKLKKAVMSVSGFRNIHQHLDLIAGLPWEGLESFRRSFNEVYGMEPDQLQLGFLKVLKGSEMWERAEEYGIVYQSEPPYEVLYTRWLSYEELQELKRVERMLELFYNSGQFGHTLTALQKWFETPYDMFLSLAEFYRERGFFVNSPSRNYRYEILLEFVRGLEAGENAEALFRELLTFDVYLREKARSRPAFARDIRDHFQEITLFYREQEKTPDLLAEYVSKGYDSRQMARMTHMDLFCYPVWDRQWLRETDPDKIRPGEEHFVLFDYEKRSPLTREAKYAII